MTREKVSTVKHATRNEWKVYLDKRPVGKIIRPAAKFQYIPVGSVSKVGGEWFDSLADCIASLKS